jgi:hypothetical protein
LIDAVVVLAVIADIVACIAVIVVSNDFTVYSTQIFQFAPHIF